MTDLELSDSDFEPVVAEDEQPCNYCNRRTQLLPDKPYCLKCKSLMFRECKRCKKPYHLARYFEKDEVRCNSCYEKLQRERLKRAMKKHKIPDDGGEEDVTPPPKQKRKPAPKSSAPQPSPTDAGVSHMFGHLFDNKDAKIGYIPIVFK